MKDVYFKTVCVFLNSAGGSLYVGVSGSDEIIVMENN